MANTEYLIKRFLAVGAHNQIEFTEIVDCYIFDFGAWSIKPKCRLLVARWVDTWYATDQITNK